MSDTFNELNNARKRYSDNMATQATEYKNNLALISVGKEPETALGMITQCRDEWWAHYSMACLVQMMLPHFASGGTGAPLNLVLAWRLLMGAVMKFTGKSADQIEADIIQSLMRERHDALLPRSPLPNVLDVGNTIVFAPDRLVYVQQQKKGVKGGRK